MYSYTKGAVQRALPANFASLLPLLCVLLPEDPALLGQAPFGKLRLAFPDLRLAARAARMAPIPVAMPPSAMIRVRNVSTTKASPR
jgi:hypothetical protein